MPGRRYVEEIGSVAMLAAKRSAGVAPEVNLSKCTMHMPLPSVNKAEPTLALKPRGDVTKSLKHGHQCPHKNDLCPPKLKLTLTVIVTDTSTETVRVNGP